MNSIISLFTGGGGPSIESVIKKQFEKQRKFIENAFEETRDFIVEQITDQSLSERIINGKSDFDSLELKHDFIMHLKDLGTDVLDKVATGIISEMSYFEHREAVAALRHSFERWCTEE